MFENIDSFLQIKTHKQWVNQVNDHWKLLLLDHAHCERKAADFAINLMKSYPDYPTLQAPLSKLIREEMRHFELCLKYLNTYEIAFKPIRPCGYAKSLHQVLSHDRREKLLDMLIVAAYIEARSCERFGLVAEVLQKPKLVKFYQRLYDAELRHFQGYLAFAYELYDQDRVHQRILEIGQAEAAFIGSTETTFRFHSARPI